MNERTVSHPPCPVRYWYGEAERSARRRDIAYMKKLFPDTVFVALEGQDHAEFFTLHPEAFCDQLNRSFRTGAILLPARPDSRIMKQKNMSDRLAGHA